MFAVAFLVALVISAVSGLPGDLARRRGSREAANALNLANAAGLLVAIGVVAALGIAHGFAGVAALVLGLVAGQQLADVVASRRSGVVAP
jgi:asparagine N-glycosylation enzyme membrane subunit Stt3